MSPSPFTNTYAYLPLLLCLIASIASAAATNATPEYFAWNNSTQEFDAKTAELPTDAHILTDLEGTWLPHKSYSQKKQDSTILGLLHNRTSGYFVDLAANHWKVLSNSLLMEHHYNWSGLCLEPNPVYLTELLSNRRCKVYTNPVSSHLEQVNFTFAGALTNAAKDAQVQGQSGGLVGAGFDNNPQVTREYVSLIAVTLDSILTHAKAPPVIDYMSLDVEGAEWEVLRAFPFEKYVFLTLSIERPSHQVHSLLVKSGYHYVKRLASFGDVLYVHDSLPHLTHLMDTHHHAQRAIWVKGFGLHNALGDYLLHPAWKHGGTIA